MSTAGRGDGHEALADTVQSLGDELQKRDGAIKRSSAKLLDLFHAWKIGRPRLSTMTLTMTMTLTHSEKTNQHQSEAWPHGHE